MGVAVKTVHGNDLLHILEQVMVQCNQNLRERKTCHIQALLASCLYPRLQAAVIAHCPEMVRISLCIPCFEKRPLPLWNAAQETQPGTLYLGQPGFWRKVFKRYKNNVLECVVCLKDGEYTWALSLQEIPSNIKTQEEHHE